MAHLTHSRSKAGFRLASRVRAGVAGLLFLAGASSLTDAQANPLLSSPPHGGIAAVEVDMAPVYLDEVSGWFLPEFEATAPYAVMLREFGTVAGFSAEGPSYGMLGLMLSLLIGISGTTALLWRNMLSGSARTSSESWY
jgi:hypothetical protein